MKSLDIADFLISVRYFIELGERQVHTEEKSEGVGRGHILGYEVIGHC